MKKNMKVTKKDIGGIKYQEIEIGPANARVRFIHNDKDDGPAHALVAILILAAIMTVCYILNI